MNLYRYVIILSLFVNFATAQKKSFFSPNKNIRVVLQMNSENSPFYFVFFQKEKVLEASELGLIREDADFYKNLKLLSVSGVSHVNEHYILQHGKQVEIDYKANRYVANFENKNGDKLEIIFQISNDGIAYRYHFPQESQEIKKITEEKSSYHFPENTKAWVQPMSKAKTGWENTNPSYEEHYEMGIPVDKKSAIGEGWVYPSLFNTGNAWILITEADLHSHYAGTHLQNNSNANTLQVVFPQKEEFFPGGVLKPHSTLPWFTPWRIIAIGDLKTVTESTLGTDLAPRPKQQNTDYIKSGIASWSWVLLKDDLTNFETSRRFIDYASRMNWDYCLVDADWDRKIGYEKMEELVEYASKRDVKMLVWYNSSGSWNGTPYTPKGKLLTSEDREKEFSKLQKMGVAGIKVDFFGGDGQSMIAYYHNILEDAARHQILVNFHGATLPRGWQRTYPNLMTMESIKGEEFITFFQENADLEPSHAAMIPFARNVFDPMDFTPMVLDSIPRITRKTTKSFELALPVLFVSGIQHIAETPEGMAKQPQYVVNYLKDIPTQWDEIKFLAGYPGKHVIMARRKENTWHIVGVNGENKEKDLEIDLSFLEGHEGILITDGENGFKKLQITANPGMKITLKPYGGFVMKFE